MTIPNRVMRVLVVDDAQTMRRIVMHQLRQLGLNNLAEAKDGAQAWDLLEHEPVDMVICDLTMPEMDGLELLKRMRGSPTHQATPFIMVTSEGRRSRVLEAVHAGATNYIVKPFSSATLREKLTRVVGEL